MDNNKRKFIFSKIFASLAGAFILYNLIINFFGVIFSPDLDLIVINDTGLIMLISVSVGFFVFSRLIKFLRVKDIINYKKKSIPPIETMRYFGLMLICNIVVSLLVKTILDLLSIKSLDISALIGNNLSIWMIIYAVLVGPLVEELLYRGYLLQGLSSFNKKSALGFSSLIFAISHGNIEQSLSVIAIALILGYVGQNISFKQALILHILNNLSSVIVTGLINKFGDTHFLTLAYSLLLYAIMAFSILLTIKKYRNSKNTAVFDREGIEGISYDELIKNEEIKEIENKEFKFSKSIYFWIILLFYLAMMLLVHLGTKNLPS